MRRNLVKRRIREGVRTSKGLLSGWDVVVHPKSVAETATEFEITSDLRGLLEFVGQRKELGTGKAKSSESSSSL